MTELLAGITDLPRILEGRYHSSTGMDLGITGARRLMDRFGIDTCDPARKTDPLGGVIGVQN